MRQARARPLTAVRLVSAAIGIGVIWLTVLAFTTANPVDLAVALLVVLAEVLAVAVLAGPLLSVIAALAAVVLVNWYLVPPYGTFAIASTENVVALIVFTLVAVVAATLMEVGGRARARADVAARQTELLSDVVMVDDTDDAAHALDRVRSGLGLDYLELCGTREGAAPVVLAVSGEPTVKPLLDIPVPVGYRLTGRGNELLAADPDFLASLGNAAVRAYEAEQMQAEAQRAEDLAAIDRARTALLASVGHDLRTPLASLRVSVDALSSPNTSLSADDRRTLLATLQASTDRLDDLITNLLDMSRLQAGAVMVQLVPTDLAAVLDSVELLFATERLTVDVPRVLPPVLADPALLERVLANLVSNSLRYAPPSTQVEAGAAVEGDHVVVSVGDRGPGIAPEDLDAVFTPFHRVGAQPDGGSGLGLAIVRGFVEAMGMTVALDARDGGGTVANVTIRTAMGPS